MERHTTLLAAAVIGLAGVAAVTATQHAKAAPHPGTGQQCFYERNIYNYTTPDNRLIYLRVGVADIYRLDLMTDCPELTFRQTIRFARSAEGDICSPVDLQIRFHQNGVERFCQVSDLRKLTPSEVAALPKADRP